MHNIEELEVESINLMRTEIVGLQFYDYARNARHIQVGDELELVREQLNVHDSYAIAVYYEGEKIGFIAKENNQMLSRMLEHGVALEAYVVEHDMKKSIYKGDGRLMANIYMLYTFVVVDEDGGDNAKH